MRISDWSSDVCSSDLIALRDPFKVAALAEARAPCRPFTAGIGGDRDGQCHPHFLQFDQYRLGDEKHHTNAWDAQGWVGTDDYTPFPAWRRSTGCSSPSVWHCTRGRDRQSAV